MLLQLDHFQLLTLAHTTFQAWSFVSVFYSKISMIAVMGLQAIGPHQVEPWP